MPDLLTLALLIAELHGLDGALFCRLIRAESDWDIYAETASSVGLAQINQSAWDWWPTDPYDPEANLTKGAEILRWNLDHWGGDTEKAVASYNLGHGRLERIIAEHGDGWREALPAEVRGYVEAVTNPPPVHLKFCVLRHERVYPF